MLFLLYPSTIRKINIKMRIRLPQNGLFMYGSREAEKLYQGSANK